MGMYAASQDRLAERGKMWSAMRWNTQTGRAGSWLVFVVRLQEQPVCIGYFFGRRTPGDEAFLKCQRLTKEFHDAFKEHCGATCCRVLTRGKEKNSPERKEQCISFVDFTVEKLAEIILREL